MPTIRESILDIVSRYLSGRTPAEHAELTDFVVAAIPDLVHLVEQAEQDAQRIATLREERDRIVAKIALAERQRDDARQRANEVERALRTAVDRMRGGNRREGG